MIKRKERREETGIPLSSSRMSGERVRERKEQRTKREGEEREPRKYAKREEEKRSLFKKAKIKDDLELMVRVTVFITFNQTPSDLEDRSKERSKESNKRNEAK